MRLYRRRIGIQSKNSPLLSPSYFFQFFLIGSLSDDDGNGNENGKKVIGLNWQNNKFARVSRFFVHFLVVVARLRCKSAYFHVLLRTCTQDNDFLFLFLNFDPVF